jgi:CubicO group peptidase (beta-lactamase class C family)
MSRDSIFRIYSMTKPITSVAAMILVKESRIELSDPISVYLPEMAKRPHRQDARAASHRRLKYT